MMGFGLILTLGIVAAIAYALGWRPQFNQTGRAQNSETPLEILKARYARAGRLAMRSMSRCGGTWKDEVPLERAFQRFGLVKRQG
jgi:hypothetical protein